jgi:hypothetical protein
LRIFGQTFRRHFQLKSRLILADGQCLSDVSDVLHSHIAAALEFSQGSLGRRHFPACMSAPIACGRSPSCYVEVVLLFAVHQTPQTNHATDQRHIHSLYRHSTPAPGNHIDKRTVSGVDFAILMQRIEKPSGLSAVQR